MKLVFLGPPGAGKGSQAELISRQFNIAHISTGNILRESLTKKTPLGLEAKEYMEKGELVPDRIVNIIVWETINSKKASNGFLLDGYPRTLSQALELENFLKRKGSSLDVVVYFETTTDVIIARLTERRVCPECGKNYHLTNMPPGEDELCDKCKMKLTQRKDDSEATVRNRLKVYSESISEILDYYREKNLLRKVSGDLDLNTINKKLKNIIEDIRQV